ncbi:MAG: serine protein kinase RIO [Acidiferrobacteraceae bacterium]|nr:serine protein kinase RIO [Acidiferrobacteraceae bacterium]
MKVPPRIQPLVEDGLVDEVISRLMSGKEADVYVVRSAGEIRCAKVYKDVTTRSFKQAVQYQEGRKVRNTRRGRAMERGSKFGKQQKEQTWHTAEVDALALLANTEVRVPEAHGLFDGVLLMELITGADGRVAPRLADISMASEEAIKDHVTVIDFIKKMLCIGMVHGDLSEFNVLVDANGPVIIDLPQAVDASANNHAQEMLVRDVRNINNYYGRFAPELFNNRSAHEMWALYEKGELYEDTPLTGIHPEDTHQADVGAVVSEIKAVLADEAKRQERLSESEN